MAGHSKSHTALSDAQGNEIGVQDFDNDRLRAMVDTIDQFRNILGSGFGGAQHISLPQLVVAGNQSAGKSSVLENLTGLPFPIGAGMCTRFATEINFRQDPVPGVEATIRTYGEKRNNDLDNFKREYATAEFGRTEFTALINDVSILFDEMTPATSRYSASRRKREIPEEVDDKMLVIDVKGPNQSLLSFVDTPGLISSGGDVSARVEKIVRRLLSEKRAIIVTVMDARQDEELQGIFNIAKDLDPKGERTLGVLTHCDALQEGGEKQNALTLAKNQKRVLKNGWFVVRNKSCSQHEQGAALCDAREAEKELFSESPWCEIDVGKQGVDKLRGYLTELFSEHVSTEFPKVMQEIREALKTEQTELENLGFERETSEQQKEFLRHLSSRYLQRTKLPRECTIWVGINNLETQFQKSLKRAYKYNFEEITARKDENADAAAGRDAEAYCKQRQTLGSDHEEQNIYLWINSHYHEYRGGSCHGLVPPKLVEDLFKKQTHPWKRHASDFLVKVAEEVKLAVRDGLRSTCSDIRVRERIQETFTAETDDLLAQAQSDMEILLDEQYARMYDIGREFEREKFAARAKRLIAALMPLNAVEAQQGVLGPVALQDVLAALQEYHHKIPRNTIDQVRDSVYEIHDILEIYCKIVCKRFVAEMLPLATKMILSADSPLLSFNQAWVNGLSATQLDFIANEEPCQRMYREELRNRVGRLNEAMDVYRSKFPGLHAGSKNLDRTTQGSIVVDDEVTAQNEEGSDVNEATAIPQGSQPDGTLSTPRRNYSPSRRSPSPRVFSSQQSPASSQSSLFTPTKALSGIDKPDYEDTNGLDMLSPNTDPQRKRSSSRRSVRHGRHVSPSPSGQNSAQPANEEEF